MSTRPMIATLVAFLIMGVAVTASANDSSFGGRGTELIPLKETRIQMRAEDIVMELADDPEIKGRAWNVEARYQFVNPTAETVSLQMGFPELHCHPDGDCNGQGGRFRRLSITVRGQKVEHRAGKVEKGTPWAPELGKVYLFDVTFAPHETVEIVHRYAYDRNHSVEGEWTEYLTRTGSLWNGPIGRARFTVRLGWRPWAVSWTPDFKLLSYDERPEGKQGGRTELVFEATEWTPKRDFKVYFPGPHNVFDTTGTSCPMPWVGSNQTPQQMVDELDASIGQELDALDDEQLVICRNLPYARHGYTFKKPELGRVFYGRGERVGKAMPWYPSMLISGSDDPDALRWRFITFRENPHYAPSLITPEDQAYVAVVKRAQERKKKAPAKKP